MCCARTRRKVADEIVAGSGLPLLHIADVTGAAIQQSGLRTVGLLGTRFTMEEAFHRGRLEERFGVEVLIPAEKDREVVHRIIYDELCRDRIEEVSRRAYVEIIGRLVERGAEGIVLGCTEIPLLIRPADVGVSLIDTTRLHAEAAVDMALAA